MGAAACCQLRFLHGALSAIHFYSLWHHCHILYTVIDMMTRKFIKNTIRAMFSSISICFAAIAESSNTS
jgi:hypothetical protein